MPDRQLLGRNEPTNAARAVGTQAGAGNAMLRPASGPGVLARVDTPGSLALPACVLGGEQFVELAELFGGHVEPAEGGFERLL